MRATLIGLVALLGSGAALALAQEMAGDPEAGHQIAGMCESCHGLDGNTAGQRTPRIGGQPAAYLAEQLHAYRSGERENYMMSDVAKELSDEQIQDLAAWYASQAVTPVLPEGYSTAAAPLSCFGCHGANGIARMQDAPNLAGYSRYYLLTQLRAYRSGEREHEVMTPIAQRLSEEEISEVADWYASIGLEVVGP
jgi:cytochrome c553